MFNNLHEHNGEPALSTLGCNTYAGVHSRHSPCLRLIDAPRVCWVALFSLQLPRYVNLRDAPVHHFRVQSDGDRRSGDED